MGFSAFQTLTAAAAMAATSDTISVLATTPYVASASGGGSGPVHRRGRFKRNARLQKGRKRLPRSRHG